MPEIQYRSVEDVGIRMPHEFATGNEPIDDGWLTQVALTAGMTRAAGIIAAAQELSADPSNKLPTILGLLKNLVFARAQQTIDEVVAKAPRLGCKNGCSYCCHQEVEVTIPEAILAFAHVADPSDQRRQGILDTAVRSQGLSKAERALSRAPCPMLVEGRCSIYESRPLACRAALAAETEQCRAAFAATSPSEKVLVERFSHAQLAVLGDQAAMRGVLKDMGLQYDVVELTRAVAALIRDPGLIDRWLSGEQAFGPEVTLQ